ncbi:RHS repeat-associated core domain-containing protein [Anaeromyxobacter dehalogenans]|uniref:RHS repeat-associated core domain-containing protein n=1 Tax=Anaeromyxobacter dehalogenans TaxID=161493 RepID=UPI0022B56804|nr:RHS repeat-associated core domain-containing protein [Anaeromyxobacter dehalogenans]
MPYGEVSETMTPDPATGRTVVTNLRLPGQYDERLLGSLGLQGPYYNWNRWYLPGVGRYLELDPLALGGEINGPGYPDWYSYANANPLRYFDETGTFVIADDLAVAGIVAALGAIAACTATNTCPWSTPICRAPPRPPDNNSCEEHRIACIAHAKVSVFYCDQCARICEYSPGKQWPWNKPGGVCQY